MARVPSSNSCAFLILLVLTGAVHGAALRKLWDFQADPATGDGTRRTVFALGFSNDGLQIAALVGHSYHDESVIVLDARDPVAHHSTVAVNPQIWQQEPGPSRRIEWSLSGSQIVLGSFLVDVRNRDSCSLPNGVGGWGFIGPKELVGYQVKPARVMFFDLNCHPTGSWELPDGDSVQSYDTSAERGLLFLTHQRITNFTASNVAIVVDAKTRKVLRRVPIPTEHTTSPAFFTRPMFAEVGQAFCGIRGEDWDSTVGCSLVDTGRVLNVRGGQHLPGIRTALASSRVVISEYSKKLDWIDLRWYPGSVRRRTLWDYRSGKEVLHWEPRMQTERQVYCFDISPDGEYIVEGGRGQFSLYKIEK
jgi:hypothetical protein